MVNLKDVSTPEQVYSEELNEILIKTPPRLFKWAILIFTACTTIVLLGGFLVDYEKSNRYDYILYRSESGAPTIVIFSKEEITQALSHNGFKLYPNAAVTKHNALTVHADSVAREEIFSINKAYSKLEAQEIKNLPEIKNVEVNFKYYIRVPESSVAPVFEDYRVGTLYLPVGKARLIRLFTGS